MATTLSATSRPNATQAATPIAKFAVPTSNWKKGLACHPMCAAAVAGKKTWETPVHSPVTPMRAITSKARSLLTKASRPGVYSASAIATTNRRGQADWVCRFIYHRFLNASSTRSTLSIFLTLGPLFL